MKSRKKDDLEQEERKRISLLFFFCSNVDVQIFVFLRINTTSILNKKIYQIVSMKRKRNFILSWKKKNDEANLTIVFALFLLNRNDLNEKENSTKKNVLFSNRIFTFRRRKTISVPTDDWLNSNEIKSRWERLFFSISKRKKLQIHFLFLYKINEKQKKNSTETKRNDWTAKTKDFQNRTNERFTF